MASGGLIGAIAIVAIIAVLFGSYYVTATPLQSSISTYQSIVSSMSANPSTTTLTSTKTQTQSVTSTTTSIITSTSTVTTPSITTQTTTSTVTSVTTYTYRIEQVPSSALVVTGESYSNSTNSVSMTVQNTENYTIYAQISATMYGNPCCGYGNTAGTYSSTVFQFNALVSTSVSFSIAQGDYFGDCVGYVSSVQLYFTVAGQSSGSQSSGTYNFEISPAFLSPYQNCP